MNMLVLKGFAQIKGTKVSKKALLTRDIVKKNRMVRSSGKRGAIELSMNTIIIVVIGITILTLGLRWIYGIFENLEGQQDQLQDLTADKLADIFGESGDAISIPSKIVSTKQGEKEKLAITWRNIYEVTHKFKFTMQIDSAPSSVQQNAVLAKLKWYKGEKIVKSGDGFQDIISFDTKGLPLGEYRFVTTLQCIDCTPPEEAGSLPLNIEIMAK